ncbi:hypothetical protein ACI3L1_12835 [Deinococcus sp. SM5_A1]|uniref:hypothetical protein n=1 Tax=Deinococcus sp. SM5_A1 TaxID=3379094 RepID=UPI00385E7898
MNPYSKEDVRYIAEHIERRNLLVHNKGKVDKKFAAIVEGITGKPVDVGISLRVASDAVDELAKKLSELAKIFARSISDKYSLALSEINIEEIEDMYRGITTDAALHMETIRKNSAVIEI